MRKKGTLYLILLPLFCLISCARRPLDILASSLKIEHIPDYSLTYEKPEFIPEHYRVNMYDLQSGKLVYKDFVPDKGGFIRSTPGLYLCYLCNFDEGGLVITGEDGISTIHITGPDAGDEDYSTFRTLQTKLRSALKSAQGTKDVTAGNDTEDGPYIDQRVITLDDYFWSGQTEVCVPYLAMSDSTCTITVNTASALKQGYVTLHGVEGAEYISNIQCFITNLAGGINPVTRELDKENVTEKFHIRHTGGTVCGAFLYFGVNEGDEPHFLYALVTDTAGGQYLFVYDLGPVDDGIGLRFDIESEMKIPEPTTSGGGGFAPRVDDWNLEYTNIPIGQVP